MQLLTVRIPETEHLPIAEREVILKRCLANEEMRRYKRIAPRVCGMLPTAFGFSFLFLALFRWNWRFLLAFMTFVSITAASFSLALVMKIALEVRILRSLIRRELRR